ncbi:MAG: hypothetical protein GYB40_07130 [Vibrionaceae bacterium]|nr:hypothetical protein [Vibrionaceae bacterium]
MLFLIFVRQFGESYLGEMSFSSSKWVLSDELGAKLFVGVYDDREHQLSNIEAMLTRPRNQWLKDQSMIWLE